MTETLPQLAADLDALLHHAALFPLDDVGWLRVTGEDRVRWLNGMVTNSIQDLVPGQGNFNFILSAQGRIQGTATAFALPDAILLETDLAQTGTIATLLDRFIIMDDVELTSVPRAGLGLAGPEAQAILVALGLSPQAAYTQITWRDAPLDLIQRPNSFVPRYELWSTPEIIAELRHHLPQISTVSPEALEALRLLEGTPRFGTDIRDTTLPQETAQTHALHFAKGCYLGQEIVERIRSRGQVHRTLHGFRLEGELPTPNAALLADDKSVGELTSAVSIPLPTGTLQLALGTIRREALVTPLTYSGGTAYPISLPYKLSS